TSVQRQIVVPVVHLSVVLRHTIDGIQRSFGVRHEFRHREKAEVHGGQARVQEQSQIRGRNSVNHQGVRFLNRVRNQPVLFRGAEFPEQPPRAQRGQAKQSLILGVDLGVFCLSRQVEPLFDRLGQPPQNQQGQRHHEGFFPLDSNEQANEEGQ